MSLQEKQLNFYLSLWELTLAEPPFVTPTSLIAKVECQGRPCILKITAEKSDEKTALALKHYAGQGAVRVIQAEKAATLMERAIPGTHLSDLVHKGKDDEATHILCDIMEKLHRNQEIIEGFPSIKGLYNGFDAYLESKDSQIPMPLVKEAKFIYEELIKSQTTTILLHGDLHHDNVVYDQERGWLSIDPKGYVGEPIYEVGALLRNPLSCPNVFQNPRQIKRRVSIICERLGFDQERVFAWAFSQAILAAIWSVEDKQSPAWALDVATNLKEINH